MPTAFEAIDRWIDEARTKLKDDGVQGEIWISFAGLSVQTGCTRDSGCSISMRRPRASALKSSEWRYTNR